jgi:flagellar protein FliL
MAKKSKTATDIVPEGEEPKKGKKKLIIIVVLVLVLGGVGYKFTLGKSGTPVKPPLVAGKVVPLESINLNLAGGHYLKLGLALQATTLAVEDPDGSKALDIAIDLLSNRSLTDLATTPARNKLQQELVTKVNEAYEDEVMDVYFTEFVTQ